MNEPEDKNLRKYIKSEKERSLFELKPWERGNGRRSLGSTPYNSGDGRACANYGRMRLQANLDTIESGEIEEN